MCVLCDLQCCLCVCHVTFSVLKRADQALSVSTSTSVTPSPVVRRILREINEFRRNPHTDVEIFPCEERCP